MAKDYINKYHVLHCHTCGVLRKHTMFVEEKPISGGGDSLATIIGFVMVGPFYLLSIFFVIVWHLITKKTIKDASNDFPKFPDISNKDNDENGIEQHLYYECKFCQTIHPDKEIRIVKAK